MKLAFLIITIFSASISFSQEKEPSDPDKKSNEAIWQKGISYLPDNTNEAEKIIAPLLAKSLKEKDDEFIARSYLAMGLVNLYNSKFYVSNEYYTKALNTEHARKNPKFASACYSNRGGNFIYLNNFSEAISNLNKSLKIAEKLGDSIDYYQTLGSIGFLDGQNRNFAEAEQKTIKALAYFERTKDSAQFPRHYQNLAMFYKNQGKLTQALENADKALKLYKDDDAQNKVKVLYIIADTRYKQGNIVASNEALAKGLHIIESSGLQMAVLTQIYYQLAKNDLSENKFGKIEEYLKKAKELIVASGVTENMDGYYFVRAEYYARTGNYNAYKKNHEEYLEYNERKDKQQSTERYNELSALYDTERKEAKISAQQQELTIKNTQLWGLAIIVFILIAASATIAYYYMRMRRYIKSLYKSNLEEANTAPFAATKDDTEDRLGILYNNILKLMEQEKLYLQPDLNISDLRAKTGSNDKYISQAINNFSNSNFNSFLNKYRINHAKKLIIQIGSNTSLKVVSAESGFNNHTTFYRQFKEVTGLTPTQFMDLSRHQE